MVPDRIQMRVDRAKVFQRTIRRILDQLLLCRCQAAHRLSVEILRCRNTVQPQHLVLLVVRHIFVEKSDDSLHLLSELASGSALIPRHTEIFRDEAVRHFVRLDSIVKRRSGRLIIEEFARLRLAQAVNKFAWLQLAEDFGGSINSTVRESSILVEEAVCLVILEVNSLLYSPTINMRRDLFVR